MRDNNRWHVRAFPARVDYKATNDYRDGNKRDISATKHYGLRKTGACDRAWLLGICQHHEQCALRLNPASLHQISPC